MLRPSTVIIIIIIIIIIISILKYVRFNWLIILAAPQSPFCTPNNNSISRIPSKVHVVP